MVFRVFLEPPQGGERLLILLAVQLQLGLREQHGIGGLRRLFESELEPLVTPLILALQMRRACGLQVIE